MFKENVLSRLSWLQLISRIVWAKNPRDPRNVAPLRLLSIIISEYPALWLSGF